MADETLSEELKHFVVPSVPQYYDFSRNETPEEIAYREGFFVSAETVKGN